MTACSTPVATVILSAAASMASAAPLTPTEIAYYTTNYGITVSNAYLLFSGTGGYTQVSGLTYNYDGTTDGNNDDLSAVPLPASGVLLLGAFVGVFGLRRRRPI